MHLGDRAEERLEEEPGALVVARELEQPPRRERAEHEQRERERRRHVLDRPRQVLARQQRRGHDGEAEPKGENCEHVEPQDWRAPHVAERRVGHHAQRRLQAEHDVEEELGCAREHGGGARV